MSSYFKILQPDRSPYKLVYSDGQNKVDIQNNSVQPYWSDYCVNNWLNDKERIYSPEQKVKIFLDSCGYFLLVNNAHDVETPYREKKRKQHEIPVSSCPSDVRDLFYGSPKQEDSSDDEDKHQDRHEEKKLTFPKNNREKTRFQKIRELKQRLGGTATSCRVDASGVFIYLNMVHKLSDEVAQYKAEQTEHGLYYAMDTVWVWRTSKGSIRFFDQSFTEIEKNKIMILE